MSREKPGESAKSIDFESALAELEQLVNQLESDELSLEQSLDQFKRGVELTRQCQLILDEAQKTVDLLSQSDDHSEAKGHEDDDTR